MWLIANVFSYYFSKGVYSVLWASSVLWMITEEIHSKRILFFFSFNERKLSANMINLRISAYRLKLRWDGTGIWRRDRALCKVCEAVRRNSNARNGNGGEKVPILIGFYSKFSHMNSLLSKDRMHLLSGRILDWGGHVISKVTRPSEDFLQNNITNLNFSWKCSAYLTFWILWCGNPLVKQQQHPVQASVSVLSQNVERKWTSRCGTGTSHCCTPCKVGQLLLACSQRWAFMEQPQHFLLLPSTHSYYFRWALN